MVNRNVSAIGKDVPKNLKFGIIVMVAIFWVEVLKTFSNMFLMNIIFAENPLLSDISIALIVTLAGYIVLIGWGKIKYFLNKVKIPEELERI